MYIALLADATCDLPRSVMTRFEGGLIATRLARSGDVPDTLVDDRTHAATSRAYRMLKEHGDDHGWAQECDTEGFIGRLKDDWLYHYDSLQVITPGALYSGSYKSLREASFILQPQVDRLRQQAYLQGHFRIRLFDSGQLYAGYGLLMHEALSLHREHHLSIDKLRKPLHAFRQRIRMLYSCPSPNSLFRARDARVGRLGWLRRGQLRWTGTTPLFSLADGEHRLVSSRIRSSATDRLLELVLARLEEQSIGYRVVNASYAGPLAEVRNRPLFRALHETVLRQGGHLWLSTMSATSAAQLGVGAFSLAYVA